MKTVYQTDKNGFFIGLTTADLSPLEQNVWLIPAGCVETAPPDFMAGQIARWNKFEWVIENISTSLEPELVPEPTTEQLATDARTQRNQLLAASDWTQVIDAPIDQAAWATYRQALRDITAQPGFPETIIWPTQP